MLTRNYSGRFVLILLGILAALPGCIPPLSAQKRNNTKVTQATKDTHVPKGDETATFAGGCFWCTEAIFTELKGVDKVVSGYSGGHVANPTYKQVCTGATGHAEAIQISFNPKVISFHDLVKIFLTTHDPTTLNRQGNDEGTQYRSAIFTHGDAQKKVAKETIQEFEKLHIWPDPIVTEIVPFTNFYPAEDYHQDFYAGNQDYPYCRIVIAPKVAKLREKYREMLKK